MEEEKLEPISEFFDLRSTNYEEVHLSLIKGGRESKRSIARALPDSTKTLLDLGVGTGLELAEIYKRFPSIEITGIDVSSKMLKIARENYPDAKLHLFKTSYFDYDYEANKFDAIISSMTLHHSHPAEKLELYKRILGALLPGGVYVENDYILSEIDMPDAAAYEKKLFAELEKLKREQALSQDGSYHFDTPCTLNHQIELLYQAGFSDVRLVWQREHNITLLAQTASR